MHFDELERSADRALRRLPTPHAPATLLPRVLAAAAALARRPWYSRTWLTWPAPLRVGSVIAAALVLALTFVFGPQLAHAGDAFSQFLDSAVATMPGVLELASGISAIVQVTLRVLEPVAAIGFALTVLMLLICGACWTAINRLTLTSERA
jgi:hypothetical protein